MKVTIHTTEAMCNAYGSDPFGIYLGNTFGAVVAGAKPALGAATLTMDYTTPEGPLTLVGSTLDRITTTVKCEGELHEISGYPEGTLGIARTTQVQLTPNSPN